MIQYYVMVEFLVPTKQRFELINIEQELNNQLALVRPGDGLAHIFVPHSTCGLVLNEDEPNLKKDFLRVFKFIEQLGPFGHDELDNNASAHLLASIFGQSLVLPIADGKIKKGAWQQIILAEFDGPRERKVIVTTVSARSS